MDRTQKILFTILEKSIIGFDLGKKFGDSEEFGEELWNDKHILQDIGRAVLEATWDYDGDETIEAVMKKYNEYRDRVGLK